MMKEHMKHIKENFSVVEHQVLEDTTANMKLIGRAFEKE